MGSQSVAMLSPEGAGGHTQDVGDCCTSPRISDGSGCDENASRHKFHTKGCAAGLIGRNSALLSCCKTNTLSFSGADCLRHPKKPKAAPNWRTDPIRKRGTAAG